MLQRRIDRERVPVPELHELVEVVGLHGRRRARVEAYWDGCLIAM